MAEAVREVSPDDIERNPENPRLIFRESELKELEDSIAAQGILVPLTVFETSKKKLVILDGERRWRCARRLGLASIPVIVQPEPDQITNIMMMFAIHNTRREWDPLPTAFKLQELEKLYKDLEGQAPNEAQLAQIASMTRGEVRRLKNMLALPQKYLDELMEEAEKPRADQRVTVDHVLEATRGASALRKRSVIDAEGERRLTDAIVAKFKSGTINSTVQPRQLARIARAVERSELSEDAASKVVSRIIADADYSIQDAFEDSVARIDYEHTVETQAARLTEKLEADLKSGRVLGADLTESLRRLKAVIDKLVSE
jgi:ParB/RepB/Spo0J family partition protein